MRVRFTIGEQLIPQPPRRRTFAASIGLHLAVILLALELDPSAAPNPYKPPTVAELVASEGLKITWYRPQDLLPAVEPSTPAEQAAGSETASRFQLKQRIAASSPDPDSSRQMIVNGPPEIRIEQEVEAANLLALAPGIKHQRFELQYRPERVRSAEKLPELSAPRIDVNAVYDEPAEMRQFERLRFLPGEEQQRKPLREALDAAAAPNIEAAPPGAGLSALNNVDRLRYEPAGGAEDRPSRRNLDAAAAPRVAPANAPGVDLTPFQRIQRLRFAVNGPRAAGPSRGALAATSAAPVVARATAPGVAVAVLQAVSPLRYEARGGAPAAMGAAGRAAIADTLGGSAAPDLLAAGPTAPPSGARSNPLALQQIARPRYVLWGSTGNGRAPEQRAIGVVRGGGSGSRPTPGLRAAGSTGTPADTSFGLVQSAVLESALSGGAPPPPSAGGGIAERNIVVVGIAPSDRVPEDLPRGRRSASFSGGPEQGSAGGGGTQTARLRVPNLMIGGRPRSEAAIVGPYGSGTVEDLKWLASFRAASEVPIHQAATLAVERTPAPIDPDHPFRNKRSYSLAINMPNITSYSGSWELHFAEIGRETEQGKLAAPTPRIKVDPRYVREAVEEAVEGEVIIHGIIQKDGAMGELQVIRGIDERLDAGALAALSKWRFDPAQKFGKPVAVEVVVRIPFRLTPAAARR